MEQSANSEAVTPSNGVQVNDSLLPITGNHDSIPEHKNVDVASVTEDKPVDGEKDAIVKTTSSKSTARTTLYTKSEMSWMNRRSLYAYDRYSQVSDAHDSICRALKTNTIPADEEGKMRKLTPAEIFTYKAKKRELALDKQDAMDDYLQKKAEADDASKHNARLRKTERKDGQEEARHLKVMNDLVKEALEGLDKAVSKGYAVQHKDIQFLVKEEKRRDFRNKVSALLIDMDNIRWDNVLRFAKVETELCRRLFAEYMRRKVVENQ